MKNLDIRPYFDDYDADKQFYQILFRPSYAIQARELNQLQTIIQEQVARHGKNIFKEGAMVIPGQMSIDTSLEYVKLETTYNSSSVDTYINQFKGTDVELIGSTSGIRAKAIIVRGSTDVAPPTIWVKYISSGDATATGSVKTFQPGEIIRTNDSVPIYATVKSTADAIGYGSSANIQKGVYFVNSRFVLVKEQTILLDDYTNSPSYRVGLQIVEDFISPEEDATLYDNAQGTTNYAAPGAHRLYIDLVLTKYSLTDVSDKAFIELVRINSGILENKVVSTDYSIIADALARRTYDESGNYAVSTFNSHVKEHRSNNRGAWQANTNYIIGDIVTVGTISYVAETSGISGLTAPTHLIGSNTNGGVVFRQENNPVYNQGAFSFENGGDSTAMALMVDPGKAYVYGYEINKIGSSTVKIDKADTYHSVGNATIQTNIGSYVIVNNINGVLDVTTFPSVDLYDRYTTTDGSASGTKIGTARARYIEYNSGTVGNDSCEYVLSLFDIKLNSSKKLSKNVRQIFFTNSSGVNFTCDMKRELKILSGAITASTGSTTVTGVGTKFTSELSAGESIGYYFSSTLNTMMVIASIESDTSLTLTANAPNNLSAVSAYSVSTTVYQPSNDSLVYPLPTKYTRKVKDINDEGTTNISYYVRQFYTGTVSGGNLIISTASSAETFASPQQPDAFHVVSATNGAIVSAAIALNGSANVATITAGAGYNGSVLGVIATVKKTTKERTKSITRAYSEDITTQTTAQTRKITLSKVDGIRLLKVVEFTDNGGTPVAFGSAIPVGSLEVDITSRYSFDTGSRDAFYDFASISNIGSITPRSPIRIYYDYFEHSSTGDYFTVDSYQKIDPVSYVTSTGDVLNLFDCVDFRPSISSSGFVASAIPAMGFDVIADYTYYLPRIDKVSLSSSGDFIVTQGAPGDIPSTPSTPENAMLMYSVLVNPSVTSTPVINVTRQDNRRYTMRDIGSIDKRLSNVEYYTALSLLESQTKNLQLFDPDGNVYFKNGFIVDSLVDQTIAETDSDEFRSAIDVDNGVLRPAFAIDNVKLIEKATTNSDRTALGYVVNNGVVTLPYTLKTMAEQPYASTTENVTPYVKVNFIGDVKLSPSSDEWYETKYKPDIVINQEGNFSAVANQYKSQLGTVWNAWQTTWVGTVDRGSSSVTSTNQVRSGTNTYVKAVYATTVIGDRTVSIDIIPFIRARTISFFGAGLKPNSKLYAYFDTVNVSSYVTASKKIGLTGKSGQFDVGTTSGADSDMVARSIAGKNDAVATGLNIGDVIHNGTGGNIALATATAVVLIDEDDCVRVVNQRGTFVIGQTVYGTISNATGVISSVETTPTLVTNAYGEVAGTFDIPSNDQVKFRTGERNFTLTDSPTNGTGFTTFASTTYSATGYLANRQRTIVSTRNGELAKEAVTGSQTLSSVTYYDPLAQSFKTPVGDGVFVDSVDVFFAGKDRILPVMFEIREMMNGTPTQTVVPGSRVTLRPSQVTTSTNSSLATRIKTRFPVYLDGDTEYCFVLISDSSYYSVWVSSLGDDDILYGQRIAKQPYLGTLFKSQNASTWTADQFKDIKFRINRCAFNTNVAANVKFANQKLDTIQLASDALRTKSGSSYIRIFVPNHGIPVGSNIVISGLTASINGISAANINGTKSVVAIEQDYVIINTVGTATITGSSHLVDVVYVSRHVRFNTANLISSHIQFNGTSIKHFIRGSNTSYAMTSVASELIPHENVILNTSLMVASKENEASFNSGYKSLEVVAQLQTTTEYLSPVFDLDRYSLICIENRIDSNPTTINFTGLDDVSTSLSVTFNASASTMTVGTTGAFAYLKVGQRISVSGASDPVNNGAITILAIDETGTTITVAKTLVNETATVTIVSYNRWFDEIAEKGSSLAKYIMKPLTLNNPATSLKVFFDVNYVNPASFSLYYRTASDGTGTDGKTWILVTPVSTPSYSNTSEFSAVEYNISTTVPFTTAQIKIVMNSTDVKSVPSFKQIRLIATS